MSSVTTPRASTQMSVHSSVRSSSVAQHSEPKTKGPGIGNLSQRSTSKSSVFQTEVRASFGDLTALAEDQPETHPHNEQTDLPFFKQDQLTDVVLQVGGRKLYTCRALLAYNSPVMAKVLSSGSKSNKDLDLPEKDYEDVVELLAYIDPRVDYIITEQSAIALLPLAAEYEIEGLKRLCEETITDSFKKQRKGKRPGSLPVEISIEYLRLADTYEFSRLRNMVTDEFVCNEDPAATRMLLESSLISEHMKLNVLDKKVEKVNFEIDKERRERTAIETKLGDYGNKRFRRPLPE